VRAILRKPIVGKSEEGDAEHPVVVVTGGTAGIGRAVVRDFAARGYDVAVLARGTDGLDAAVTDVEQAGRRAIAMPTDVADAEAVDAAARAVEAELGPISVWVNNAFTGRRRGGHASAALDVGRCVHHRNRPREPDRTRADGPLPRTNRHQGPAGPGARPGLAPHEHLESAGRRPRRPR
jgi:NAD(P)-dependent dehydrogenase (short-subunit alcohol dehydrogenase family)